MTRAQNLFAFLTAIASVYCVGLFVWSWFPALWDIADAFRFLR